MYNGNGLIGDKDWKVMVLFCRSSLVVMKVKVNVLLCVFVNFSLLKADERPIFTHLLDNNGIRKKSRSNQIYKNEPFMLGHVFVKRTE